MSKDVPGHERLLLINFCNNKTIKRSTPFVRITKTFIFITKYNYTIHGI